MVTGTARRRLAVATAFVLALGVVTPAAARPANTPPGAPDGWSAVATPNVPVPNGRPSDVTCRPDGTCVMVGSSLDTTGSPSLEVQRRVAGTWHADPVTQVGPDARLVGVSCSTDGTCVAVGGRGPVATQTPFAESWNGTRWVVEAVPGVAGKPYSWFASVSCVSTALCVAVGQSLGTAAGGPTPFAAVRRAGVGSALPTPPGVTGFASRLTAVSCTTTTSCHAVGWSNGVGSTPRQTVVDAWDGTTWTALPSVTGQFEDVSCPAVDRCTAVGEGLDRIRGLFAGIIAGTTVTKVAVTAKGYRHIPQLTSVSCSSTTSCRAVGDDHGNGASPFSLVTADGGTTWTTDRTPPGVLLAISCSSTPDCTAVGTAGHRPLSVVGHLRAGHWTTEPVPDTLGVVDDELVGLSCRAATACLAVDADHAHLAHWDGASWTPLAPPTGVTVDDVSCATATVCLAVGQQAGVGVSALWSAGTWTVATIGALPAGVTSLLPAHVSCASPTRCALVGYDTTGGASPSDAGLVGAWDGRTWTFAATPSGTDLHAVSCSSRTRCVAAGQHFPGQETRFNDPVAAQFDGTSWTSVTLPAPATADWNVAINGVSCSADGVCTAVGSSTRSITQFVEQPLVEVGTVAAGWTIAPTPAPTDGPVPVRLEAVSCPSSTVCTVLGTTADSDNGTAGAVVLRSAADGWHSQPSPATSAGVRLPAVSCPNLGWCAAVGSAKPRSDSGRLTFGMVWNDDVA